jgi:NADPH:quinone reductase-like Zn-dependent oxidoreductase
MGARVLAGIPRPERAASVRAAGADAVIDLSAADLRDSLRAQVHAVTEGRGVDIILDPLGGRIFEAAVRTLAWRGRLVVIGFATGAIPTIRTNYLLLKNIEISGLQISDYRALRRHPFRWLGPARRSPHCATAALPAAPCYTCAMTDGSVNGDATPTSRGVWSRISDVAAPA